MGFIFPFLKEFLGIPVKNGAHNVIKAFIGRILFLGKNFERVFLDGKKKELFKLFSYFWIDRILGFLVGKLGNVDCSEQLAEQFHGHNYKPSFIIVYGKKH